MRCETKAKNILEEDLSNISAAGTLLLLEFFSSIFLIFIEAKSESVFSESALPMEENIFALPKTFPSSLQSPDSKWPFEQSEFGTCCICNLH